jgi:protein-tyrosine phosphatase
MLNISPVDPLLYVGGQFRPAQWPQLHDLGVRAVLSLRAEHVDAFEGPPPPRVHRIMVPDYFAPSLDQIIEGVAFVSAAHAENLPVLIHCHAGVGRAPLLAAAYLMSSQQIDHRAALAQLRRARPIIGPNRHQLARLREYEALI